MFVVYVKETGEELDRYYHWDEAQDAMRHYNDTNSWEYSATYRREA